MNDAFNSAALHIADYIKADVRTAYRTSPQLDKWPRKCGCCGNK